MFVFALSSMRLRPLRLWIESIKVSEKGNRLIAGCKCYSGKRLDLFFVLSPIGLQVLEALVECAKCSLRSHLLSTFTFVSDVITWSLLTSVIYV